MCESIRITARFAVEAPVAMLRVYCSWPGVSAMMNFRRGRFKIAVGDVDGNALLALGAQAVGEQRKIHRARRAIDAALFYGGELILEDGFGIVQQAADERRFAVVHAARRGEAQQILFEILLA